MCSVVTEEPASTSGQRPLEVVEREICELAAHLAAAMCRWLMLVAEFDAREGWAEWGVHSCAHWLSWRCGIALRSAREHVRVARALESLPLIRAAFATGEISYSKARALTRVADERTEADLVELARHATGAQLERLVRSYAGVLAASVGGARQALAQRSLTYHWEDDGSLRLQARLPAAEGAIVISALQAAEERLPEPEPEESLEVDPLPRGARRADALVELARAGGTEDVGGAPVAGGGEALVTVHVDARSLTADDVHERCELEDGPALVPELARRLACDGSIVRIIERDGRPLSVGRRTRVVSPALRRALRSRDGGCRFPGCTHGRFLHAHHIRHWARGGATALSNLVQLCPHHHRLVHEGGFAVATCADGRLEFRRPGGAVIPPGPVRCPVPAGTDAITAGNRRRGLVINPDTAFPRSAGDPLDYGIAIDGLIRRALDDP